MNAGIVLLYGDDDIVLNTFYIKDLLTQSMIQHLSSQPVILGSVYDQPKVERVGKNMVSMKEFR